MAEHKKYTQEWQKSLPEGHGSLTVKHQKKVLWRSSVFKMRHSVREYQLATIARWDDECGNRSNSFHVRTDFVLANTEKSSEQFSLGDEPIKVKNEIPKAMRDLEKWNGCHPFGPWYYMANPLYLAGDRDHWGLRKGEQRQIRNGKTGKLGWKLTMVTDDYRTLTEKPQDYLSADEAPGQVYKMVYLPWMQEGEGKERELDAARRSAIWPEATDEELMSDNLDELLAARLPALIREFRSTIELLGFTW